MSIRTILRLSCDGCGRNLLDVRQNPDAHHANGLQILVTPRPGVLLEDHLPNDGPDLTFSAVCRCGRKHDRRESRLRDYWHEHAARPSARVVLAVLGRDL